MFLVLANILLWALWKSFAVYENRYRQESSDIPFYYSGTLGDSIGFSLLAYAASLKLYSTIDWWLICIAALLSLIITYQLDCYWRVRAKNLIGSMYTSTGSVTLAGRLHWMYVFFVTLLVGIFIMYTLIYVNWSGVGYFLTGVAIYAVTVAIDHYRGVI